MKRYVNAVVIGLLAVVCGGVVPAGTAGIVSAMAQGDEGWGRGRETGRYEEVIRGLNLTAQQQERISRRRAEQREKRAQWRERMGAVREDLRTELESDKPDRARIDRLNAEMKGIVGEGMDERIEGVMTMREILTPEQFKALNKRMDEQRESRTEGFKKGRVMDQRGE